MGSLEGGMDDAKTLSLRVSLPSSILISKVGWLALVQAAMMHSLYYGRQAQNGTEGSRMNFLCQLWISLCVRYILLTCEE